MSSNVTSFVYLEQILESIKLDRTEELRLLHLMVLFIVKSTGVLLCHI